MAIVRHAPGSHAYTQARIRENNNRFHVGQGRRNAEAAEARLRQDQNTAFIADLFGSKLGLYCAVGIGWMVWANLDTLLAGAAVLGVCAVFVAACIAIIVEVGKTLRQYINSQWIQNPQE